MSLSPISDDVLVPLIRNALAEDLGTVGDITTKATIPSDLKWKGALVARQAGVIAGLDLARLAFHALDPHVVFDVCIRDGEAVKPKDVIAHMSGNARAIITGERVALNYLSRLSGIASATRQLVEAVKPHKAQICCTRKTTPGLRLVEKYAVRAGGGANHRFGLYDAVLIKDNHIAASGSIRDAVLNARKEVGPRVKVELEVDTLDQLQQALDLPLDAVLLDNMDIGTLKKAVAMVGGKFITEASGRINLETAPAIAATGVDMISVGWITHSAPILDIGLDEI